MIATLLAGLVGVIIVTRAKPKLIPVPARVRSHDPRVRRRR